MKNNLLIKFMLFVFVVFAMALVPVLNPSAEETNTYTITIKKNENMKEFTASRFKAYQLFKGKVNEVNKNQLSDIEWGDDVKSSELVQALKNDETLKNSFTDLAATEDETEAEKVANILASKKDDAEFLRAFAKLVKENLQENKQGTASTLDGEKNATISVSAPGYYIVIDTDNNQDKEKNAISDFILDVLGSKEVNVKADVPSLTKEIVLGNEAKKGTTLNIGDEVTFRLTGTLPSTLDDYKTYSYKIVDTLGTGLTYKEGSLTVKVGDQTVDSSKYQVTNNNGILTITFDDAKTIATGINSNSKIIVEYKATLNNIAGVGDTVNTNKAHLEYSNDPNNSESTGTTVEDVVYIYTFEYEIKKVDEKEETKVLSGAEFILYKKDGETPKYAAFENDNGTLKFKEWKDNESEATKLTTDSNGKIFFKGLGEGTYYLKETKAPVGYDLPKSDTQITVTATIDDSGSLTNLTATGTGASATVDTDKKISMTVKNHYSTILPSTGGIGTIIFYVAGGLLLAGSVGYILFGKKDKSKAE